ncbi:MAG: hypothetical protein COU66_01230 [Candidatus Pacebacteria bacterium CG10_big_fil_rev_8_21_14_0_10_44_11]|nr:MAG: hypothetical protein COU66_01230 [Candidatus Pacebacteria bacterium CG10_big_fil_rev_8_21_14_0_10_44_11]
MATSTQLLREQQPVPLKLGVEQKIEGLYQPVPLDAGHIDGWKEVPIQENGELLVPIGLGSSYNFLYTSSIYFGERTDSPYIGRGFEGSLVTIFVRESVANQLVEAEKLLPKRHHLILFDAYRSLQVQDSLFTSYIKALSKLHPDWSKEQLLIETQKYVSLPSTENTKPSPHNTGASVDLAIFVLSEADDTHLSELLSQLSTTSGWEQLMIQVLATDLIAHSANLLDFGTQYDYGGAAAALVYYELLNRQRSLSPTEKEALLNRRLLFNVMLQVGLEAYKDEWWHYNARKSQMGAKTAGLPHAEYGAARLSSENIGHERKRRKFLRRVATIQNGFEVTRNISQHLTQALLAFKNTAQATKNIRETSISNAAEIHPTA